MKHKRKPIWILFLCLLMVGSCTKTENQEQGEDQNYYFDLESYVDSLIENGMSTGNVEKQVTLNGKMEQQNIPKYNFSGELNILKKYNINKPSLAGKYKMEESSENGNQKIIYTTLDEDLKTKKIEIHKYKEEVFQILIEGQMKSILSNTQQTIIFAPEKSYHLVSQDNNRFSKNLKKEILIKF